jgi:hypothetical protein
MLRAIGDTFQIWKCLSHLYTGDDIQSRPSRQSKSSHTVVQRCIHFCVGNGEFLFHRSSMASGLINPHVEVQHML